MLDGTVQVGDVDLPGYQVMSVAGLRSIAHLVSRTSGRCGVYVLRFRNADRYVGQAVDVAVRFAAHRRAYGDDIVEIAFRRVARRSLDLAERAEIQRLHQAVPLRNVVDTPGRLGASDFDELVPPQEQQDWLTSRPATLTGVERTEPPQLRQRQQYRFARLAADERFPALAELLHRYLAWTVPSPGRTELSYWSLSAVPTTNSATYPRLLTLSVHTLETLYVCTPKARPDELMIVLNADLGTLLDHHGSLNSFESRTGAVVREADYAVRSSVATLETGSTAEARDLLAEPSVMAAARRLNLDLMRKGPTMHWRSHCYDLGDVAFGRAA
ncbi:GIY-YIG nuclease family protein [Catellatospora paridis]|uniref:GIY-YIG nuclease family protein n=1 Tax=Catellatospora paridis TaxID=1617086 RepID=UPI0012D419E4|nr:GIY-YIG nuclease family protein [Catellatospora paridis]